VALGGSHGGRTAVPERAEAFSAVPSQSSKAIRRQTSLLPTRRRSASFFRDSRPVGGPCHPPSVREIARRSTAPRRSRSPTRETAAAARDTAPLLDGSCRLSRFQISPINSASGFGFVPAHATPTAMQPRHDPRAVEEGHVAPGALTASRNGQYRTPGWLKKGMFGSRKNCKTSVSGSSARRGERPRVRGPLPEDPSRNMVAMPG